jgi:3-hydroxyacyl-[acyl-carrier-protein] dehydratase
MENNEEVLSFDSIGIQQCQRNRYPMLFVDKMVEVIPGKSAHGIKNFTYNEWFFPPHFDDEPYVPGFVQLESLVQTFLMTFLCYDEYKGKKASDASINNVKFKRKIIPGDKLDIFATLESFKRGIAKGHVESFVNGEQACSAEFIVVINDVLNQFTPKANEKQD